MTDPSVFLQIGERVQITNSSASPNQTQLKGTLRFVGLTQFSAGKWAGVELDEPLGKNDGQVQGHRYFQCEPNFGVFVRVSQVKSLTSGASPEPGQETADTTLKSSRPASPAASGTASTAATTNPATSRLSSVGISRLSPPKKHAASTLDSQNAAAGRSAAQTPTPGTESPRSAMTSSRELEELRLKVKWLEQKRLEDKERSKDGEKLKMENEQLLAAKGKLSGTFSC